MCLYLAIHCKPQIPWYHSQCLALSHNLSPRVQCFLARVLLCQPQLCALLWYVLSLKHFLRWKIWIFTLSSLIAPSWLFMRRYLLALSLCPVGTFVRWGLSTATSRIHSRVSSDTTAPLFLRLWKNSKFPFHTLVANVLACVTLAAVLSGMRGSPTTFITREYGTSKSDWCWAISMGVCGCMSTVSTFVHEAAGGAVPLGRAYIYVLISVALGVGVLLPAAIVL